MKGKLFIFAATAALVAGASPAAAVVISDFENGTVDGWQTNDATVTLSSVAGGSGGSNFALRVDRTTGGWNQSMVTVLSAAEWVGFAAGTTVTFDLKAQGGTDVPGWWLQLIPIVNSETGGWDQTVTPAISLDGQWHTYSVTYPAQAATPGGWSELVLVSQGGAGTNPTGPNMTFFLDNVSVAPVPEPGSLAALGVGGAALLGRRRRR